MLKYVLIALGGALGAMLRYGLSGLTHKFTDGAFPWGTLNVNLLGSLAIGLIWGLTETTLVTQNARLFLLIGVLGSFTTFSAFSLENLHLFRDGEYGLAGLNIILNVLGGMALVFAGYFFVRFLTEFAK